MGVSSTQGTASEATLVALLSARTQHLRQILGDKFSHSPDEGIINKMVAYCSIQASVYMTSCWNDVFKEKSYIN